MESRWNILNNKTLFYLHLGAMLVMPYVIGMPFGIKINMKNRQKQFDEG